VDELLSLWFGVFSFLPGWAWGIAAVLMLLVLVMLLGRMNPAPKYDGKQYLFTKTEWAFFNILHGAVGERYLVMGKPRIADVLFVRKGQTRSDWARAFSQISSKHIDYVIVEPQKGRIVAAIELDDPSHQRKDRQERDVFVNRAFMEAGIPLLRYPTAKEYDASIIARDVEDAAMERLSRVAQ
tara:strand:- start:3061 stop:3609 length:549 start_codon:yes stop_codon:yes gene_type:complete